MVTEFYKRNENDVIWWRRDTEQRGARVFSFDKKTVFYPNTDYPNKLTKKQKEIFDKENPLWAKMYGK